MPCKGNVFISNCKYKSFQAFVLISAFDFRATVIITIIKSYTKNGPLSNSHILLHLCSQGSKSHSNDTSLKLL